MPITVTKAQYERDIRTRAGMQRPISPIPNAIADFLEGHEIAGTPNEFTITGLGEIHVKLGDLRNLVRTVKQFTKDADR